MQRPLDIHKLGFVLENNPNPRVRNEIAMTIASNLDEASIPYLEQALKDPGIWSRGGVIGGWRHFYVSDTAAYALAQINGQDAQDILSKYLYERDGEPSIDLILKRLDSGLEPFGRNPIRTQLALTLAFQGACRSFASPSRKSYECRAKWIQRHVSGGKCTDQIWRTSGS